MAGRDERVGADGCGGDGGVGTDAAVDSVEGTGRVCEFEPLQPTSHAIIKTDEKIVFKSGFIHTTLTHAL